MRVKFRGESTSGMKEKEKNIVKEVLPSRELASKGGKVVVGGEGELGRGDKVHHRGGLRHLGGGLLGLAGDERRGVDRHDD